MENQYEIEVDLRDLLKYILKKAKIVVITVLLFAVVGFIVSGFILSPQYEASTRIYVLNRESEKAVSYSDYQVSNQMIADYRVLITGENVTKEVIRSLNLDLSVKELERKIHITTPENTRVLQITVKDVDPLRAANIANSVREIASVQLQSIMNVETVSLVYEAEVPKEPAGPDVLAATLAAAGMGLVLTVAILTGIYVKDDTIRTEEDVERYLGLSVLGVVPNSKDISSLRSENEKKVKRNKAIQKKPENR